MRASETHVNLSRAWFINYAQAEQISQLVDMQRQLNDSVLAVHAAAGKINDDEAAARVSRLEGRVDELSSRLSGSTTAGAFPDYP